MKKNREDKHPWRENIEALTMAVAVALIFKVFLLEISKIPSGSMQPTLMGSPQTQVFDRIVVDKLSFHYRDPKRFEIVVFKHPLEESRIMVKRLVGIGGEDFKIQYGDLWTRSGEGEPWRILRRPEPVREEMWKSLQPKDARRLEWRMGAGTSGWHFKGRTIRAVGAGQALFRPDEGSIRNRYSDGYPDSVRGEIQPTDRGFLPVGDLRLEGEVTPEEGTETVTLVLSEGDRSCQFILPGPASPAGTRASIRVLRIGTGEELASIRSEEDARLEPGDAQRFAVENIDDRLTLEWGDDVLCTLDVDPVEKPTSSIRVEVAGSGALFEDLMPYRDVYYFWPANPSAPWIVEIPEGHYVMLGDNTRDSADSRDWRFATFTFEEDGVRVTKKGNYRPGSSQANPIAVRFGDEPGWVFRDRFGDLHWLPESRVEGRSLQGTPAPLVPRELITGRAVSVFWPISISRRMWRLTWLH
ncbi:MAG TPA: signal peptidase I [Planctomycetes bacterium]|nr:signal peptidase I [Planctomycetota bacterium]